MKGPTVSVIQECVKYDSPTTGQNARSILSMLGTVVVAVALLGALSGCVSLGATKDQSVAIQRMAQSYVTSQASVAQIPQLVVECEAGCSVTLHREYTVQQGQHIVTNGEVAKAGIKAAADVAKSVIPQVVQQATFTAIANTLGKANQTLNVNGGSTVDQSNSVNTDTSQRNGNNTELSTTASTESNVTTTDSNDSQFADSNDSYTETHSSESFTDSNDSHSEDNNSVNTSTTTTDSNNQSLDSNER